MSWRFYCKSCAAALGTLVFYARPGTVRLTAVQCATCGEMHDYTGDDLRED